MKRTKWIVVVLLCIVGCSLAGCGGGFGEGVVTGAAAAGAIEGVRAALIQREADLNARYEVALNGYETSVTEAEKQVVLAKLKSLEEQREENQRWQLITAMAEKGTKADWGNPQTVADFTQLAVMLGLGGYFAKKITKAEKAK